MVARKARRLPRRERRARQRAETAAVAAPMRRHIVSLKVRKLILAVIAFVALLSVYISIFHRMASRVTVEPLSLTDPKDASSTIFAITNGAPVSIRDVVVSSRFANYYIRAYGTGGVAVRKRLPGETKRSEIGDIHSMTMTNGYHHRISPQEAEMMKLPLSLQADSLDVEILVDYRPAWYPVRRHKVFRFVTRSGSDGQIHWLPRSDAAPPLFVDPPMLGIPPSSP